MNLETVNIILALIAISGLIYIISKGKENFRQVNECKASTQKYCNMLKQDKHDIWGSPLVLSEMMQTCGGGAYPDVQDCYPEWATVRGGTEKANIDLILEQVSNKMY